MWSYKYQKENMSLIHFKCTEKAALKKEYKWNDSIFLLKKM